MSRGLGSGQRTVLEAIEVVGERDAAQFSPHRFRWLNLEMCGLVQGCSPASTRSSLSRSIRALASEGYLELSRERVPYDLMGIDGPDAYPAPLLVDEIDPNADRPGRRLWFRRSGAPYLFCRDVLEFPEEQIPENDASFKLAHMISWADGELDDYITTLDREAALNSETGRFLRWYFFGLLPHP